jgi:hypothetical protein
MQVYFGLHAVTTARELSHCPFPHRRPVEPEGGAMTMLNGIDIVLQAFLKHLLFVGT